MHSTDWPCAVEAALVVPLLTIAAWTDIATRTIPDSIAAAIAVLGIAVRLFAGPSELLISIAVALVLFALFVVLHARGAFGGGDVKLAAAICLGLSPFAAYRFIYVTAMAGGVLALLHLAARRAVKNRPPSPPPPRGAPLLRRVFCAERWRIARHGSLSYGVAIAYGGIWAVMNELGN